MYRVTWQLWSKNKSKHFISEKLMWHPVDYSVHVAFMKKAKIEIFCYQANGIAMFWQFS